MRNYLAFLYVNMLKKKTIWITAAIYLAFLMVCIVIVPPIFKYDYMFIWNNSVIDIKSTALIIISCFCSVLAVAIFRDPIDDGTELITISKPISRKKIMLSKFIVFVTFCMFLALMSSLIVAGGSFFPFNTTQDEV
jgi:ABC-2 type transport system permease protein